jgi:hypothetical protein
VLDGSLASSVTAPPHLDLILPDISPTWGASSPPVRGKLADAPTPVREAPLADAGTPVREAPLTCALTPARAGDPADAMLSP